MRYVFMFSVFLALLSCGGGNKSSTGDPTLDLLLRDNEDSVVNFNLSGLTVCNSCTQSQIEATGILIRVYPSQNPNSTMAEAAHTQLGPFSFLNLSYIAGAEITVQATLLTDSSHEVGGLAFGATKKVRIPNDSGETVSVTLNFPDN